MAANAITTTAVSVTTSETSLYSRSSRRKHVRIFNNHASEKLFVGPTGVTTSTGQPIVAQQAIELRNDEQLIAAGEQLFGICATGPIDTRILAVVD